MRGRTWAKRIGLGVLLLALAAGGFAAATWPDLPARYAAHRLRTAATDDERTRAAADLAARGDAGFAYLVECFRAGDPPACAAAANALRERFAGLPAADPALAAAAERLRAADPFAPAGTEAVLGLVPELLRSSDPACVAACRDLVRLGLAAPSADAKVQAIRLALRPDANLAADVVPLLNDPDPGVRSAALLAVGPPGDGPPVVGDEELFRWLNDPDPGVRKLCSSALVARGRSADEVEFGRKLTHPDVRERLGLLLDLRWADDSVKDVGPWLERLSRDPDPAVRAGAARVAVECRVLFAAWVDKLAAEDPNPTVRRVAGYYRGLASGVVPAGHEPP
jgi:hypothetical protein